MIYILLPNGHLAGEILHEISHILSRNFNSGHHFTDHEHSAGNETHHHAESQEHDHHDTHAHQPSHDHELLKALTDSLESETPDTPLKKESSNILDKHLLPETSIILTLIRKQGPENFGPHNMSPLNVNNTLLKPPIFFTNS
ncbi:hypothetical protein [Robertkochia solimangrovi]|uniref:hypothetical protein n=1 Tax=Robertkochia solimangrovi TaxID=2213046 RepID=UPI00117CC4B5|nr:hypothetical protein [Robertkochia solimangrovi]TRZ46170.1 hypothetical protein DMZ48_02620 [Robertkochia solimangrovi]